MSGLVHSVRGGCHDVGSHLCQLPSIQRERLNDLIPFSGLPECVRKFLGLGDLDRNGCLESAAKVDLSESTEMTDGGALGTVIANG